jgi:hypothetical protein
MSTADEQAIEEARQQIRALVDEIETLSRNNLAEADFFRGLLDRVIEAMGAVAGLVWLIGEQGRVEPVCHAGMQGTGLTDEKESQEAHGRLVQTLIGRPHRARRQAGRRQSERPARRLFADRSGGQSRRADRGLPPPECSRRRAGLSQVSRAGVGRSRRLPRAAATRHARLAAGGARAGRPLQPRGA